MADFELHAVNPEGFLVILKGTYPEEYNNAAMLVADIDLGFKTTIGQASAAAKGAAPAAAGGLACRICTKQVQPVTMPGKDTIPADKIAAGRSEKMVKMGREAGPVCGDCWTRGGHSAAWKAYYDGGGR